MNYTCTSRIKHNGKHYEAGDPIKLKADDPTTQRLLDRGRIVTAAAEPEQKPEPKQPEPKQPEPKQPEPKQPEPKQPEPKQPESNTKGAANK